MLPWKPMPCNCSLVAWLKLKTTLLLFVPSTFMPMNCMRALAPETLTSTVEPAGALMVMPLAFHSWAALRLKTFWPAFFPDSVRAPYQLLTAPVAFMPFQVFERLVSSVLAAAKSIGLPWRMSPFGRPNMSVFTDVP